MYIQGLLQNEKESLIPKTVIVAKQTVLVTIQVYWFQTKNNVSLMLIDNLLARSGC